VVDDDPIICKYLKRGLSRRGNYKVLVAKKGTVGLLFIKCRWRRPDLVLLDLMMEGIDGFEVLRRLRSNPRTVDIPVIIVTAYPGYDEKMKAEGLYFNDYIVKPVDLDTLVNRIQVLLNKRNQK
jgi:DNA-binding response OmpR family regulator